MDDARLVEECFWELGELLDVERIVRPGWVEIRCEGGGDMRNGVLHAELDSNDVEDAILATVSRFAELGTPFRWHVGPSDRPADLERRLVAHGMSHVDTLAGMITDTNRRVAEPDPRISVAPLLDEERAGFVAVIASTFEVPDGVEDRLLADLARADGRQRHYAARLDGALVGATTFATLRHAGFLQGAAVLEAHRGQGVYRQMIQTRLDALRELGYARAVITARHATSAPICARLGFTHACDIRVYRSPDPAAGSRFRHR